MGDQWLKESLGVYISRDLEIWEDGYFARTVGDKVPTGVIRKYIKYHREQEESPKQLELF